MILMCVLLRRNKSRLFSVLGLQNGLYIDTTQICLQVKTKLAKLNLHMLGHMLVETCRNHWIFHCLGSSQV